MGNNRLFIVLLFFTSLLGAQEYYVKKDGDESRIYQRLAWQADENAMRYEVVIEQSDKKGERFVELRREYTEDSFIEVSLPPGIYRYRVTAYNFLNRSGIPSEWAFLEILLAQVPELLGFSPNVFYLDGDLPYVLNITGRNIAEKAEIYLKHQGKDLVIVPEEYTIGDSLSENEDTESSAEQYRQIFLFFNIQQLVPGNYELCIKNPGGFEASGGPVEIRVNYKFDMYIGLAYTALISVYGDFQKPGEHPVSFAGAAARFGIVPIKKPYGFFGAELSVNWNSLSSIIGPYTSSLQVIGPELNLLYQKWLSDQPMAFTFRAGGGFYTTLNYLITESATGKKESVSITIPLLKAGPGFLWLINDRFFVEVEVDFVQWLKGKSPIYIRPWLGGGIKLK